MPGKFIGTNLKENVNYTDENGLPVKSGKCELSLFPDMTGTCHWHNEIEIVLVEEGCLNYYVEGITYYLKKGSGIIVNTDRLHYAMSANRTDCTFKLLLFHPSLLTSNRAIYFKYVEPLLRDSQNDAILLDTARDWCLPAYELAEETYRICQLKKVGYEMRLQAILSNFWLLLYENTILINGSRTNVSISAAAMKSMIEYIHRHYAEKISLNDIAEAGIMSRTKCCNLFRENMNQTPIEFLSCYRIHRSIELLADPSLSISEIAQECGFYGASYFAETFRRIIGLSPRDYRNRFFHR
jgi:AraC-type DNA-binding domain-containing proteins